MEPVLFLFYLIRLQRKCFLLKKRNIKSTMKFKNILDPEGQVFSLNKMDKIFKNKSLNSIFCRNDC